MASSLLNSNFVIVKCILIYCIARLAAPAIGSLLVANGDNFFIGGDIMVQIFLPSWISLLFDTFALPSPIPPCKFFGFYQVLVPSSSEVHSSFRTLSSKHDGTFLNAGSVKSLLAYFFNCKEYKPSGTLVVLESLHSFNEPEVSE